MRYNYKSHKFYLVFALLAIGGIILIASKYIHSGTSKAVVSQVLEPAPPTSQYLYQNISKDFAVYLGDRVQENKPKVRFEQNNSSAEFSLGELPNADAKFEKKDEKSVVYKDIYPGIDLLYSLTEKGIKEEVVLNHQASTINHQSFTFALNLKNAVPKKDLQGNLTPTFIDPVSGNYLFHIPQPFMVDAKGNRSEDVKLRVDSRSDLRGSVFYTTTLIPDAAWLTDPARVYPIIIDPTIVHDTSSEFATGTFNRVKDTGSGSSPNLTTYYRELPTDRHTVGLWHMNETVNDSCSGGQDACDSSGNGNHGTATGTTIDTTNQKLGAAARSFNGTSDYVTTGTSGFPTGNGARTLEAWFKLSSFPAAGNYYFLTSYGTGATNQAFGIAVKTVDSATHRIGFSQWGAEILGTTEIALNTWYHFVVTHDGSTQRIFLNGVQENSGTLTVSTVIGNSYIGQWVNATNKIDGLIDEVRISNTARTPEEVKTDAQRLPYSVHTSDVIDFANNITSWNSFSWTELGVATGDGETASSSANLVAQWNFNETSGTTAANNAGVGSCGGTPTNCNGTLTNFANTTGQDVAAGSGWTANNKRWGAGAIMFDGSNDWLSIPDSDNWNFGTNNFSLETWFKASKTGLQTLFYQGDQEGTASTVAFIYRINSSSFLEFIPDYPTYPSHHSVASTKRVDDGSWHHGVITRNGSTFTLYVDGKQENTLTLSYTMINSASPVAIGAMTNGVYNQFSGVIDSSRLYSRSLSASEILSNYQAGNIELQTRVGANNSPDGGTWEDWKPTTGETQIESMDESMEKWQVDSYQNSSSTISKISGIDDGDGADGAITVSANKNINTDNMITGRSCADGGDAVNYSVTANTTAGSTSVTLSSTPSSGCLAAGDEFLIINLQGTSSNYGAVGQWETHTISSISTATLNFTDYPLRHTYDGTSQKIMVQRVPNYTNVTVDATYALTANAWDGTKGGVLFFRATETVTVSGTISVNEKGYTEGMRGGPGSPNYIDCTGTIGYAGNNGDGGNGTSISGSNTLGGGTGGTRGSNGCVYGQNAGGGGGGGAYGTNPTAATAGGCYNTCLGYAGSGGSIYGNELLFLGSGGGGGGGSINAVGGVGGKGGGIISISVNTLTLTGSVTVNGQAGANGAAADGAGGGGGGGSSGSILIKGNTLTLGSNLVTATGGNGGSGGVGTVKTGGNGGSGGSGRIAIYYTSSLSGTTNPVAFTQKYDSQVKAEGNGAMKVITGAPQVDSATVGLWHMEETSGTGAYIKDSTANANHGTPTGTSVVDGFYGKARNFNGSSDYINVPNSSSLDYGNNFTIDAWIKTSTVGWRWIVTKPSGSWLGINGSGYLTWTKSAGTDYVSTTNVADGNWHHVAVTFNNGALILYSDGINIASWTGVTLSVTSGAEYIGQRGDGIEFFQGIIDEVRISNSTRTAEEIAEAYRAGQGHRLSRSISSTDLTNKSKLPFYVAADRPGTYLEATIGESAYANYEADSSTVGLWHLEEQTGSGAYIKDSSNNANHGTPTGTTFVQGKLGRARSFNGSSDYINVPYSASLDLSAVTMEAWVKLNGTGVYALIDKGGDWNVDNPNYGMLYSSDKVYIIWNGGYCGSDSTGLLSDGKWHHLAGSMTNGATDEKIYVDGILRSCTRSGGNIIMTTGNRPLMIGRSETAAYPYYTNGSLDEVRISSTARSADDIRQSFEIGKRTHPITIDFKAKLDYTDLITGSSDLSFTVLATSSGTTNKGDNLYKGDKVIVKENVGGTEYLAQGTVTSVNTSTGSVSVSAWDTGSTFPSGGYTANATVFKWQREMWDISGPLDDHINAASRITLRVTDGSEGANIWLDDFKHVSNYLTNPSGSTIASSTGYRYFQYRAIFSTWDTNVSPSLTSVTIDATTNNPPNTPTLDSPTNGATNVSLTPPLKTTATDSESDYLRYKIQIATDSNFTQNLQTFDQTVSQTGWSGQNTQSGTAYTSGTQATYTLQSALSAGTTYFWRSYAIDPGGSNTWSSTQGTPNSFTTTQTPNAPSSLLAEGQTNPTSVTDTTPEFSAIYNDPDSGDIANKYWIQVDDDPAFGSTIWDSGAAGTSMTNCTQGNRCQDITYAGSSLAPNTTYYWRIKYWDQGGAEGGWSTETAYFTTSQVYASTGCLIDDGGQPNQLIVKWQDNTTWETGFRIERNVDSGEFTFLTNKAADSTSHTDSSTSANHTYQYRVRAEGVSENSDWCNTPTVNLGVGDVNISGVNISGMSIK